MASSPLTLAALATSAVSDLEPIAARPFHEEGTNYRSAVLTTADAEVIISVPRHAAAEVSQAANILALTALTEGARALLPFAVPEVLGLTRAGNTRAVASTFLPGGTITAAELESDALLVAPIALATAAIHELPRSIVQQGGLPVRSAQDLRLGATRVIDRADATRMLPETVHRRWLEVTEAAELWDFAPVTTHGALSDSVLLIHEDEVVGVLGWGGLSVGDPAADLAWLHGAAPGTVAAVLERYLSHTDGGSPESLRARSLLYHELRIAEWLLHGVEAHDSAVVDDAVALLDRLVDRLSILEPVAPARETLDSAQVEQLLEQVPDVADGRSDTAAHESLDEDRMFAQDTDLIAPLEPQAAPDDATDEVAADPDISEQETEAYDDDDLPGPPGTEPSPH